MKKTLSEETSALVNALICAGQKTTTVQRVVAMKPGESQEQALARLARFKATAAIQKARQP